jgi:hypothetical protein
MALNFRVNSNRTHPLFVAPKSPRYELFIVVWMIGVLISLGLLVSMIYVACHFISKYW